MDRLGIIDKANKCGRLDAYLGGIIEFNGLTAMKRRGILGR